MTTPVFSTAELPAGAAAPEAVVNRMTRREEFLIAGKVLARNQNAPAGGESEGTGYIIGSSPSGSFATFTAGNFAFLNNGAWEQIAVPSDYRALVWSAADSAYYTRQSGTWTQDHAGLVSIEEGDGDSLFDSVGLLLHFDGSDAATSTTDESNSGHSITFGGNAQLDTAQKKFGTASLLLDGAGDYLTAPNHADFRLGSGNWTIEAQVWFDDVSSGGGFDDYTHTIACLWNADGVNRRSWLLRMNFLSGNLEFSYSTDGSASSTPAWAWSPSVDTFYHLRVVRSGGNLYAFVNGSAIGTTQAVSGSFYANTTDTLDIGRNRHGSGAGSWFEGQMDEFRITKAARSTSGFTAPSAAFDAFAPETFGAIDYPLRLKSYTVATAPSAASIGAGNAIYVTDGDAGSPCVAVSNGTDWKVVSLGATIAAS